MIRGAVSARSGSLWLRETVPLLTGNGYSASGGCYLNFLVNDLVVDPVNGTAVID